MTVTAGDSEARSLSPCIASGAERTKFEQLKADSGYLHGPLADELANDANHFSEGAVQLLKFHGSYQQDNREGSFSAVGPSWPLAPRCCWWNPTPAWPSASGNCWPPAPCPAVG